ncbi:MAG: hypothetical protein EPN22_02860 [Nitrospirae bacterium]|nr:MAG: hypothetical protein EPN22_02860 [Nitrospirota bacterium]
MKTGIWLLICVIVWGLGFIGGYKLSYSTGVQPGYFEAAEAGGYGSGGDTVEGIDKKTQDYYKELYKDE